MQDVKSVENVDITNLIVDLGTVQIYTSTVQDLIDNAYIISIHAPTKGATESVSFQ